MVTIAHIARTKTEGENRPPSQALGKDVGRNGIGESQSTPTPATHASARAMGGRMTALELSVVTSIGLTVYLA